MISFFKAFKFIFNVLMTKYVYFVSDIDCPFFFRVPEHVVCHWISRWIHAFFAISCLLQGHDKRDPVFEVFTVSNNKIVNLCYNVV